jgi:hypothetical protein
MLGPATNTVCWCVYVLWILWFLILIFCKFGFLLFEWHTDVNVSLWNVIMFPMFLFYLAFHSCTNVLVNQRVKCFFFCVCGFLIFIIKGSYSAVFETEQWTRIPESFKCHFLWTKDTADCGCSISACKQ